jgi:carbamoyl-phosphate synthase large subunit
LESKTVLVTGIGGNVGQGIIRNILDTNFPIKIIGTNISKLSAGNHWVDSFYIVPYGYAGNYIKEIKKIIEKEKIDLIIPSTDFETYTLSQNEKQLTCKISCSGKNATSIYLDKYDTWLHHSKYSIPFSQSSLPSEYSSQFEQNIAKPRQGRGSKGLVFNIQDTSSLRDKEYLIQNLEQGIEITTAVYRSYINKEILGFISMERSLENGATTYCRVTKEHDSQIEKIAQKMILHSDLRGSFNIQSIVNKKNQVIPFEINCRISGTNSIRSGFGFKDVKYTLEELLWARNPEKINTSNGIAFRYLHDVIYPHGIDENLKGNQTDNFKEF